ncbi:MAG: exosortase system-associated protein, TIGR04073 family [Verrucomicrobiota bacterium]
MKKLLAALLLTSVSAGSALADIQDPIRDSYGPSIKLGRGLSNLLYSITEVPITMIRERDKGNASAAFGTGLTLGVKRMVVRIGYGAFEVVTFPFPAYKETYRPPIWNKDYINPNTGYDAYPPELAFESKYPHTRTYP